MKVSVVIPIYNGARWLCRAVDSVLRQVGVETEIICVNDGSTDDSAKILDRLSERFGIVVLTQENRGLCRARNRGLAAATGECVMFLDADDEIIGEDALLKLTELMRKDGLDVLCFDAELSIDSAMAISSTAYAAANYVRLADYSRVRTGAELFTDMVCNHDFASSSCLLILDRMFVSVAELSFPDMPYYHEDNIFTTHVLLAASRASHRPWRCYRRYVHEASIVTTRPTIRHLRGCMACYLDAMSLVASGRFGRPIRKALRDRAVAYKTRIRHMVEDCPELQSLARRELDDTEYRRMVSVLEYPIWEKCCNGLRCLHDRGLLFTVKRIFRGRQS